MPPAEEGSDDDDCSAGFDEEFAAVEPVDGGAFQVWVGEEGVPEKSDGGEVDGEMKGFPETTAQANTEVGGDDENGDDIESDGAESVFEGLLRGVDGEKDVEDAKVRGVVEEQDERMNGGEEESKVAGPVVDTEIVEAAMRPGAFWAITKDHECTEKHVESDSANGGEAEVGAEIEETDVHSRREPGIGFETA